MSEMSPTIDALFAEALAFPPTERGAFLARACGADVELLARLAALIAAHEGPDSLMASAPAARLTGSREEGAGDAIGHYKLLQKIGEGGCGVVWMAEQEEPVRRRVALKVIKLGMDTKAVVARFEAERQALAMMDHPNIAKVHDAGVTETGRPFFVMELVRGISITKYCDENQLTPTARLELFIRVCHAVQHAHQKGIIHRDLKPSNILVTVNDGAATPKVIDFGIAKATQGKLTDATVFTAFEQFIGTPVYMSPEQAEMSSLDIDTRSDIYSLGVLLYELLTGRPPFDPKKLAQGGVDWIRQQIRVIEPPRPSARLRTLDNDERTTVARLRATAPGHLSLILRGDLDWIVMRCLEKDRTRRYETASGLATDIQRHLRHEPVIARPPSTVYLLRKLIRRHRFGFVAGALIGCSLILGFGLSLWSWWNEKAARQQSLTAERKAVAAANAAHAAETLARESAATARTAESDARLARQLADDARDQAEKLVGFLLDDFYRELAPTGRVDTIARFADQVVSYYDGLPPALQSTSTARARALAGAREAMALRRQHQTVVDTTRDSSITRRALNSSNARAHRMLRDAVESLERLHAAGDSSEPTLYSLAVAWRGLGEMVGTTVLDLTSLATLQKAEETIRPIIVAGGASSRLRLEFAEILHAHAAREQFNHRTGRELIDEARKVLADLGALELTDLSISSAYAKVTNLGGLAGDNREGYQTEALAIAEKILARQPADLEALRVRASANAALGSNAEARFDYAEAWELMLRAEKASEDVLRFDPLDSVATQRLYSTRSSLAAMFIARGQIGAGLVKLRTVAAGIDDPRARMSASISIQSALVQIVALETARGNWNAAAKAMVDRERIRFSTRYNPGSEALNQVRTALDAASEQRQLKLITADYETVLASGEAMLQQLVRLENSAGVTGTDRSHIRRYRDTARYQMGQACVMLGRFTAAETNLRDNSLREFGYWGTGALSSVEPELWLALALARQGRAEDAGRILSPVMERVRTMKSQGAGSLRSREVLAQALLVSALAQPGDVDGRGRQAAAIDEATQVLAALSDESKALPHIRILLRWISEEQERFASRDNSSQRIGR